MGTNKGESFTKANKQPAINIINLSESQAPNSSEFAASLKHLSSRQGCIESAERTSLHFTDALRRSGTRPANKIFEGL